MIGFYNYSVIVTYLGVISSMIGISLACNGIFDGAILCLALAGACDTFDGKIARAMKNRTHEMEIFGVQIPCVIWSASASHRLSSAIRWALRVWQASAVRSFSSSAA